MNSTGKGWYEQVYINTTGGTQYSINNIYDMAGNVYELTTEDWIDSGDSWPICRGGHFGDTGMDYPAAYRWFNTGDFPKTTVGMRVVLYK